MKIIRAFARLPLAGSGEIGDASGEVETDELVDPACALIERISGRRCVCCERADSL